MWCDLKFSCWHFHIFSNMCIRQWRGMYFMTFCYVRGICIYSAWCSHTWNISFLKSPNSSKSVDTFRVRRYFTFFLVFMTFGTWGCTFELSLIAWRSSTPLYGKLMTKYFHCQWHWNGCFSKNIHCPAIYLELGSLPRFLDTGYVLIT